MSTDPNAGTPPTGPTGPTRVTPSMLLTALVYAREFGWHVFPVWWIKENGDCACPTASRTRVAGACDRKGKHPITARGFVDATTDQGQIRTWWGKYPHANIGVATGASRLILVDADRHHAGCDGVEELHHLERQHGELPDGPIALTGGGGEHRLFRRPANLDAKLNSWPLAPGVDTRADLGYFVAPPSRHESGRTYEWDAAHDPTDTVVPECPAWIIQKLRTPKRKPIASGGSVMTGFLALAFKHAGLLERVIDDQRAVVQCPWESDHTTGRGSSTIVFAPSAGRSRGWFHCLGAFSRVVMADGSTREIRHVKVGDLVLSRDGHDVVTKQVVRTYRQPMNQKPGDRGWYVVRLASSRVLHHGALTGPRFTSDHRIDTANRGIIEVGQLKPGDLVYTDQPALTENARQIILGSLLGDGYVERRRSEARVSITHHAPQIPYAEAKAAILAPVLGGEVKYQQRVTNYTTTPADAAIYVSHRRASLGGLGDIPVPEIIKQIDARGLAIWYQDDGTLDGRDVPTICGAWLSTEERRAVAARLIERFGFRFVSFDSGDLYIPADSRDDFFTTIARFVHPSLAYKLPERYRFAATWRWDDYPTELATDTVVSVEPAPPFRGDAWCYDIEVEDTHNFYVKNGPERSFNTQNCSHSHCAGRTQDDVLAKIPEAARTAAAREQVDTTREAAQARAGGGGEPDAAAPALSRDAVLELLRDRLRWTVRGSGDDQREVLVASLGNVATFLEYDPRLEHSIVYNEFAARRQLLQAPPWDPRSACPRDWCDADDVQGAEWLEREFGFVVGKQMVFDAACVVGQRHPIHPVRDYLNGLTWDGTPRLDGWLTEFCGADDTELIRAWASKWVISAVARIYQPGAKADHVLILEGKQGLRKSTALEALAGPDWFTDAADRLTDKDGVLNCSGKWIMELGELVALTRAEATHIKAFFSRRTDRIRRPYGRSAEDIPRQTVFCGTTNATEYLRDDTGNRRFWSVAVGKVDVEGIREHRDQLWAEAVHRYRAGETWWLDRDDLIAEAEEAQEERRHVDPWARKIEAWLHGSALRSVTLNQVIEDGLGKNVTDFREAETQRAARAIMALGWKKVRRRTGDRLWWAYERPFEVE